MKLQELRKIIREEIRQTKSTRGTKGGKTIDFYIENFELLSVDENSRRSLYYFKGPSEIYTDAPESIKQTFFIAVPKIDNLIPKTYDSQGGDRAKKAILNYIDTKLK